MRINHSSPEFEISHKRYKWNEMVLHHTEPPHFCKLIYKKTGKFAQFLSRADAQSLIPDIDDRIENGQVVFDLDKSNSDQQEQHARAVKKTELTLKDFVSLTAQLSQSSLRECMSIDLENGGKMQIRIVA